jgi:hypothetical protein
MAITVTQCEQWIRLTLGGRPDAVLNTLELVNLAGSHFCGMSKWRFLMRKFSLRDTVASQSYVTTPDDFGGVITLAGVGANAYYTESDYATIATLQNGTTTSGVTGNPYMYAIVDTTPSGSTASVRHLELFPVPSTTTTGAMALVYRAKWADLTSDSDYILFPDYTKALFVRVLMAFARGLQREEQGSLSQRLAELQTSPEFLSAVRQDRAMQSDLGEIEGSVQDYPIDRGRIIFSGTITGP